MLQTLGILKVKFTIVCLNDKEDPLCVFLMIANTKELLWTN